MNTREALKEARRLGLDVHPVPGTGEVEVVIPGRCRVRTSAGRKDAPRILEKWVRRVAKERKKT